MKPDWAEAPDWANFIALDASGVWYWHEKMPTLGDVLWKQPMSGKMCVAKPDLEAWKSSLEPRP